MLSRRTLLLGAAAVRTPPNLLWILADDHAGYVFGADGNSRAHTPNLDRLAAESTRFAMNHCNAPVCTPSRQSFLTGQMPHMAGVTRLPTPLADDKPTVARQLRSAGYLTAVFGKMHFNRPSFPGQHGFEIAVTEADVQREWTAQVKARPVTESIRTKPPWRPFKDPARIWLNADKLPFPRFYEDMKGTWIARQACAFLEQNRSRHFALWVSFMEPHSPFDFPLEARAEFDPAELPPPRVGPQDGPQIPIIFRALSETDKRGIIAADYTSVSFMDRNVGVVLDKLRTLGLADNTLVVYMADHGYCLGHHGRFEKHCCYDPALRVPLLMRFPGRIRQGVVNELTESVDVPFTILDLLDAAPLPVQHGRSLRAYLQGGRVEPRDHIFSEYLENEEAAVRTRRWKFIHCSGRRARQDGYITDNPIPGRYVRLFDLKTDPGEFTDVAARHPDLVERFQRLMLERFRKTHPEAAEEPSRLSRAEAIDWYLRPRDA